MALVIPPFSSNLVRTLWVRSQLTLIGKSYSSIARDHGWTPEAVRVALHKAMDAQERAIADALGVAQRDLFPDRFDASGNRLHHVRKPTDSRTSPHVKNHEAA